MLLAVDAGGGPIGVSDLEKPFAGTFYFALKAQLSQAQRALWQEPGLLRGQAPHKGRSGSDKK